MEEEPNSQGPEGEVSKRKHWKYRIKVLDGNKIQYLKTIEYKCTSCGRNQDSSINIAIICLITTIFYFNNTVLPN